MKILILLLVMFLGGCATTVETQQVQMNSQSQMVKSVGDFPWLRLKLAETLRSDLQKMGLVSLFGNTKSYFVPLDLEGLSGKLLEIESEFNGSFVGQYFEPSVIFYTKDLAPLGSTALYSEFVDSTWKKHTFMRASVPIPANAAYAAVFTEKSGESVRTAYMRGGAASRLSYGLVGVLSFRVE
jgi:hypothetical protein